MKKLFLQKYRLQTIFLVGCILLVLYLVSASLNPFDGQMFEFHDETQTGRITSFVTNLKHGQIPPRIAPEYSFNLGFPVFNYYAPTAYWITSLIALTGISELIAVKISFLIGVMVAFLAMLYLLTRFFDYYSSLLGAAVYVTSTYMATEIVIRGNLAETWFLAFFPLALGLIIQSSRSKDFKIYLGTVLCLALLFTSHNMLSLFSIPIVFIMALLLPHKKRSIISIIQALVIDSYFLIPAFLESSLVQANTIAKNFNYVDHFLCTWQLWSAHGWQFGGSLAGCDADMMSFKLGKLHLVMAGLGVLFFIFMTTRSYLKKRKLVNTDLIFGFFACLFIGSLFLTLYQSKFIWDAFKSIMALFQFPWRFLVFGMFGSAFFSAYLFDLFGQIKPMVKIPIIAGIILVLFVTGYKYFVKPQLPQEAYYNRYTSDGYRAELLAYNMREYLPKGVNYTKWHYLNPLEVERKELGFDYKVPVQFNKGFDVIQNEPFRKKVAIKDDGELFVNVHSLPHWHIYNNNTEIKPDSFDDLARPIISVKKGDNLQVKFKQTNLEMLANILTIVGIGFFFVISKKKMTFS